MEAGTDRHISNVGLDFFHTSEPGERRDNSGASFDWHAYKKEAKHNESGLDSDPCAKQETMSPCPDSAFVVAPEFAGATLEDFNDLDISFSKGEYIVTPDSTSNNSNGGGSPNVFSTSNDGGNANKNTADDPNEVAKKKAQNRAAQRAFRERREQKVKELDARLAEANMTIENLNKQLDEMKNLTTILQVENNCLKEQLARQPLASSAVSTQPSRTTESKALDEYPITMDTEETLCPLSKEILQSPPLLQQQQQQQQHQQQHQQQQKVGFPSNLFYESLLRSHYKGITDIPKEPATLVYESSDSSDTLLSAGAIWQFINEDPSIPEDLDLAKVVEFLKDKGMCDGNGPVYPLRKVKEAVAFAIQQNE